MCALMGSAKTLDQRDGTGSCGGFGKTGFAGQMRGNGSGSDDAQHLAHDVQVGFGKQKAQRERYSESPTDAWADEEGSHPPAGRRCPPFGVHRNCNKNRASYN